MIMGCQVDEYLLLTTITATIPQLYVLKAVEVCKAYNIITYNNFTIISSELSERYQLVQILWFCNLICICQVLAYLVSPLCPIYLYSYCSCYWLWLLWLIDLLIDHSLLQITILLFRLILIAAVQLDPLVKRRRDFIFTRIQHIHNHVMCKYFQWSWWCVGGWSESLVWLLRPTRPKKMLIREVRRSFVTSVVTYKVWIRI